jgi:outer membrane receptor protein involved in Fe transport
MKINKTKLSLAVLSALAYSAHAEDLETSKINVYSPAPLPSIGLDQSIVPGSIQVIKPEDVQQQSGVSLADYLNNNTQGISFNEVGGNSWQPEVFYRGYSAGSIAGNPQGLSIYVDGVRENQPFSDVVLWDTIPTWALSGAQVVGGSNPIYGLNTLGGAISMQTKNGKMFNKGVISATAGSWDRTAGLIEMGGILEGTNIDYYFGYNHTSENGWRDYSPSHLNQAFGKIGMDLETGGRVELSYTGASNNLIGNGLAPKYLLGADNSGVNTVPDATENRYNKFNLSYTDLISDTVMLSTNAYYIQSNRYTLNGDAELEQEYETGDMGTTLSSLSDGRSSSVSRYFISGEFETTGGRLTPEAETRTTRTKQDKYGITAQLTFTDDLFGYKNHLVTGVNLETSLIGFVQNEYEESSFIGNSRVVDTATGDYENNTDLQGRTKTAGLYAVDTLSLNDQWHVTGGLRYNYTEIDNKDRRADQSEGSLTEKMSFSRINPTIGVAFKPNDNYQTYVSYSESNRAPTSIELGCSNPEISCTLPTQMADDPPLDDIVSKTYEAGAAGRLTGDIKWNMAIYHAMNHDDIHFINKNAQNGLGYFDNVGRTRRDGLDLGVSGSGLFGLDLFGQGSKFSWSGSYGYVNATYDSDLDLVSDANSSRSLSTTSFNSFSDEDLAGEDGDSATETLVNLADVYGAARWGGADVSGITLGDDVSAGDEADFVEWVENNVGIETNIINVSKGDRLANIPQHRLKARLNYEAAPNLRFGLTGLAYGKTYMMGNENQEHNGDGENPGYMIFNADMNWSPAKNWLVSLKAINLLDKDYYSGGRLLMNGFTGDGNQGRLSDPFRGAGVIPGSPQAAWITIGYQFK